MTYYAQIIIVCRLAWDWLIGWLIGFYPQGPRKGIFVSSKAHVSPPTCILSDHAMATRL